MRHGKLITEESNIAKTQRDENARLWEALQQATANGDHFETVEEVKSLSLDEVTKRLKELKNKNELGCKWPDLDEIRWQRLAWRAKHFGFSNPFVLVKNGAEN